ncbi:putative c6 transcription factor protein [Neofusicoccum parvum UCRNP2]|uniref:Putative c6 transcription factor protein n=1 Tax=Botryosphaeria parva (strain UCR-NP2) TaxID=1287680 RepID=R1H3M3_BOTPV|nr:putative c6 transcription factor protein [Neofusicoccum parvum UCRNP2]
MESSAEPPRAPHVLPGLQAPSRSPDSYASYRTPPSAAPTDRYYATASPSHRPSIAASQSESVQLPSLRTLIHPQLLSSAAPSASPAPVTRLPSLSGFDQGLPADRSVNGHGYAAREENQVPHSSALPASSGPQPYPTYTSAAASLPAAVTGIRTHAPASDSTYQSVRHESISSGVSAGSENPSPGLSGQTSNTDGMKVDLSETLITSVKQHPEDSYSSQASPSQQPQRTISPPSRGLAKPQHIFNEIGKPGDPDASRKRRYRSSSDEEDNLRTALAPRVATTGAEGSAMHAIARSSLDLDPYEQDPILTKHLLDLFFTYVNSSTYAVFPREPFMRWVTNRQPKTTDEKLVIYSLLVMGNVFSTEPEWRHTEKQLLEICNTGLQRRIGKFTLHMCLSRLYIGLAHFARGRHEEAWDWCGAFLRAISALKLNLEDGVSSDDAEGLFGFDRRMGEECRLRTFWAGFLMDRYNGFSGGTLFTIGVDDVCVRLPCSKAAYDAGHPLETPVFDGGYIEERALLRNISPMGYHSLVSAIWGDVWTFTTRAARKPTSMRLNEYTAFYDQTNERLDEWVACLPAELQYNEDNFYSAIDAGYAGTFVGMHALHQATIMRLNRYARHSSLPPHILSRNAYRASTTARHLLCNIIAPVTQAVRSQRLGPNHAFSFATPFPGYAVLIATDILSAGGIADDITTTMEIITNGLKLLSYG